MRINKIIQCFLSIGLLMLILAACTNNEQKSAEIEAAVAETLAAQSSIQTAEAPKPSPTPKATNTIAATATEIPTEVPIDYTVKITCPDTMQPLAVNRVGESWRYGIEGSVLPYTVAENLSLNVVYQRLGADATAWTFIYGKGAKPRADGVFLVEGWIGNEDFPPEQDELVAVAIALMDDDTAASLDNQTFDSLYDIPAESVSFDMTYKISLNSSCPRCRGIAQDYGNPPENGFIVDITCPKGEALTIDSIGEDEKQTWRYAVGGVISPATVPEYLTANIIYKRISEDPTNWIFVNSGGARPHPDGQFLVEGFIGNQDNPPQPGETIAIVVAFTDESKANAQDRATLSDPYQFRAEYFSNPAYFHIREEGEDIFRCRDAACTPNQPTTNAGHLIQITCPSMDNALTADQVGESWRYHIGGTISPYPIPDNAALFVAYKRIETGSDWILINKPATPSRLNNAEQVNMGEFRAEGWIGNEDFPPQPGELIAVTIVMMDESEGRQLNNQEFRTLEQINAIAYSFPTYVTIRDTGEEEYRCTGAELPDANLISTSDSPFKAEFEQNDTNTWQMADGWTNGPPFWVGWRADHVEFSNGLLRLRLDDIPCTSDAANCSAQPYASGEYRSNDDFQYGCFSGNFKAAGESGVITSLFTYTGPSDGNPHDEIDIEILGNNTNQMQVNYYTGGISHEHIVDLGFDAADDFHTYAFEWSEDTIKWFVDGKLVHTENGSNGPIPTTPGKIMMNLWPVDSSASNWAGEFVYPESPIYAEYDWIQYAPSPCTETN